MPLFNPEVDPPEDPAIRWNSPDLDLPAYLRRVGFGGSITPTLENLRALHRAHATTIPFENLDILLGAPLDIDLESLQRKLVASHRGGYCFEHNPLFAAVLERIGFHPRGYAARIRMGSTKLRPASHAVLSVEVENERWLADVGFGGEGLLEPIPLRDGFESRQGAWTFRLDREREEWVVSSHHPDGWFPLYSFTLDRRYRCDYEVTNHYTSTHPRSPFVRRIVAQRTGESLRRTLHGRTFTVTRPRQAPVIRTLPAEEIPALLNGEFGIVLAADQGRSLVEVARHAD